MKWLDKHPQVKKVLTISAKHAVNVIMTNTGLTALFPQVFNFHHPAGIIAYLKAAGLSIAMREFMVWGPKIIRWSVTEVEDTPAPAEKAQAAKQGQ